MANSRSVFVLAADRWMPSGMTKQSRKTGMPVVAILSSSAIYAFFSLINFVGLIAIDVFLINLLLLINLAALIALRIKRPDLPRPAKIPGGWWGIAAIGVPMTVLIVYLAWTVFIDYGQVGVILIVGTLAVSTLAYFPARRYRLRHQENRDGTQSGLREQPAFE